MSKVISKNGVISGISGRVSAPQTYTVQYFDGPATYTERFAVINIGSQYTGNGAMAADALIAQVDLLLAGTAIGAALIPIANTAMNWLRNMIFNPDGSVTLMFAYHYCGTAKSGIDPTFFPGGLETRSWQSLVDNLLVAAGALGNGLRTENQISNKLEMPSKIISDGNKHSTKNLKGPIDDVWRIPNAYNAISNNGGKTFIDNDESQSPATASNALENLNSLTGKDWISYYIGIGQEAALGEVKIVHINVNSTRNVTVE